MTRLSILALLLVISLVSVMADDWEDPAYIEFRKAPLAIVTQKVEADATLVITVFPCGKTALQAKVLAGDIVSTNYLLDHGAPPNALDYSQGRTALIMAVSGSNLSIVQALLKAGADPNIADMNRNTPVSIAIERKNLPVLSALIEAGGSCKRQSGQKPVSQLVMRTYSIEILKYLMDKNLIDVNERGENGETPLLTADGSAVSLLLEKGANPADTDINGMNKVDRLPVALKLILDSPLCPDINKLAPDGMTPLMRALSYGRRPDDIKLFIDHKADLSRYSDDGRSIWDFCKNPAVQQLLLENGANPNQLSQYGSTLLHDAVNKADIERVKLLLKYKADPKMKNRAGLTPLQSLLTNPKLDHYDSPPPTWPKVVELANTLMDAGFDPQTTIKDGKTWLHLLAYDGYGELIDRFVKAGVDINGRDAAGRTPLFNVQQGNMVAVLVKAGADVNARDLMGRTMLTVIKSKQDPYSREIAKNLEKNGGIE